MYVLKTSLHDILFARKYSDIQKNYLSRLPHHLGSHPSRNTCYRKVDPKRTFLRESSGIASADCTFLVDCESFCLLHGVHLAGSYMRILIV